ncbi:hypothetical protein C8Q77DRAFT_1154027 [Trametes polyzona]|nr:hypothetical protein C8Q77DRAFT_1154027 [Trametes polyzona]
MRFSWRVGFICFFALVACFQLVGALPAAKDESSTTQSESSTPASHGTSASSSTPTRDARTTGRGPGVDGSDDATQTGPFTDRRSTSDTDTSTTSRHSIIIAPTAHRTRPHPSGSATPGAPFTHHFPPPPNPTAPSPRPHPPPPPPAPAQRGQPPIAIAFEVLGGVVALAIFVGIARCYIVWRRTPPRDRIAALMSRHQLEREMAEMEQERMERLNQALEARRWRPPPPPYQPAPDYDTVVRPESSPLVSSS